MSGGQAVGTVVGAVIGFVGSGFNPAGAVKGAYWGYMVGTAVDPPPGPHLEGPRLNDRVVQTSEDGAPLALDWGTTRHAGNVIWSTGLEEVSTETEQSGGGSGGGGATLTSYTYRTDVAIAICEGPISGIRRIWADSKLIYDISENSDIASLIASSLVASDIRIYTGSETQEPDPLIQAIEGIANAPAYRGTSYILFDNLFLADYGNRLPNFSFEVVKDDGFSGVVVDSTTSYIYGVFTGVSPGYKIIHIKSDGEAQYYGTLTLAPYTDHPYYGYRVISVEFWNLKHSSTTPELIRSVTPSTTVWFKSYIEHTKSDIMAVSFNVINTTGHVNSVTIEYDDDGVGVVRNESRSTASSATALISKVIHRYSDDDIVVYYIDGSVDCNTGRYKYSDVYTQHDEEPSDLVTGLGLSNYSNIDAAGDYIYIATGGTSSRAIKQYDRLFNLIASVSISNGYNYPAVYCDDSGHVVTLSQSVDDTHGVVMVAHDYDITNIASQGNSIVVTGENYPKFIFYSGNVAIMTNIDARARVIITIDRLTALPESLDIVVSEIIESSGLSPSEYDVTALAPYDVRGYTLSTPMAMRAALEPLQVAFAFDIAEVDGVLKCILRGGSSVATIPDDDLGAAENPGSAKVNLIRHNDSELPSEVQISYSDIDNDYQAGTQYARSLTATATNIRQISLPLVMTSQEAAKLAEVILASARYTGRHTLSFSLSYEYSRLVPTDIITLPAYGAQWTVKISQIDIGMPGIVACIASPEIAALYASSASASDAAGIGQTIGIRGTTTLLLIDCCMLRDIDNSLGWYLAMTGSSDTWPGGAAYKSSDGGATWNQMATATRAQSASIGAATTLLGDADSRVWDKSNTVNVMLRSGTLSSATETSVLDGANAGLLGASGRWELIQWLTATLEVDGSYTLTDLLRGRRGTEHACASHAIGDTFVPISATTMQQAEVSASELDAERLFKAATSGQLIEEVGSSAYTYTGERLMPLAPANCHAVALASGGYVVKWDRRDRVGLAWNTYSILPLSEESEAYEIDVINGSGVVIATQAASASGATLTNYVDTYDADGYEIDGLIEVGANYIAIDHHYSTTGDYLAITKRATATHAVVSGVPAGARWKAPDKFHGIATDGAGILYVSAHSTSVGLSASVSRIDTSSMTATHSYVASSAADIGDLAYANGYVWAILPYSGTIKKLVAADLTVSATITAPASKLVSDGTDLFYSDGTDLKKIDGATNAITTIASAAAGYSYWPQFVSGGYIYGWYGYGGSFDLVKTLISTGAKTTVSAGRPHEFTGPVISGRVACAGGYIYDIAGGSFTDLPDSTRDIQAASTAVYYTWSQAHLVNSTAVIQSGAASVYNPSNGSSAQYHGWSGYLLSTTLSGSSVKVYQISATVGRGHPATATIDTL